MNAIDVSGIDIDAATSIAAHRSAQRDAAFGSAQPPIPRPSILDGLKAWEKDIDGTPLQNPFSCIIGPVDSDAEHDPVIVATQRSTLLACLNFDALRRNQVIYMWVVDHAANLVVAPVAYCYETPSAERYAIDTFAGPRHLQYYVDGRQDLPDLGHPTLVKGGACRIAGDLQYSSDRAHFVIRNYSGRYAAYVDRTYTHLLNVTHVFTSRLNDIPIIAELYKSESGALLPLVLPSSARQPTQQGDGY